MHLPAADLFRIDQILHKHGAKFSNALVREQHILQVKDPLYIVYTSSMHMFATARDLFRIDQILIYLGLTRGTRPSSKTCLVNPLPTLTGRGAACRRHRHRAAATAAATAAAPPPQTALN